MSQDRATFRELAEPRFSEARVLLVSGRPSGAYYLAGYAVECALKAKIAAEFRAEMIPSLSLVRDVYTHDLGKLLSLAGLRDALEAEMEANPNLKECWTTITGWSEQARYETWSPEAAEAMVEAVEADGEGLLPWLRTRW
jgi:HEPN domain-containing protein